MGAALAQRVLKKNTATYEIIITENNRKHAKKPGAEACKRDYRFGFASGSTFSQTKGSSVRVLNKSWALKCILANTGNYCASLGEHAYAADKEPGNNGGWRLS